ncbi:MAG: AAA family ATPase [Gammaproteobacteria bacterium]|nr:AAA family ATPase [Gammaproteobacteria bacterium]MBU1479406.1 AAA family ATPase [Gammaproteobacteria bacterium]MBU2002114.1 AAA family ATPase [Gammaproteobacteria bacterium]MBU2187359.1 AAA family ATPase [Gammaproteobacteria bacterium]MBU2297473.1 AAA family ATPase [Gammaproteobacteria bacterium]
MHSYIQVKTLILVGVRKNYITKFHSGVNIIYGDSDTGKSSILELINYLLGSSSIEVGDEISTSVKYAALEIDLNGKLKTIVREIYDNNAYVNVYPCTFDKISNFHPDIYCPNFNNNNAPDGFYSDFLLDSLNFPKVKIRKAPTKASSDMQRLGFRSLFKYCYLNQDDVGSKSFLDLGNWGKATINREVFKYIFNVLDSNITEMQQEIGLKTKTIQLTKSKLNTVSEFLRDTNCKSLDDIDFKLEAIEEMSEHLSDELSSLNREMVASSENYTKLNSIFKELSLNEKSMKSQIQSTGQLIDKYSRLKNDYGNDINKIKSTLVAQDRIGDVSVMNRLTNPASLCPVCEQDLKPSLEDTHYLISPKDMLNQELTSLKNRRRDITSLIESCSHKSQTLQRALIPVQEDISKIRTMIDTESVEMITPYLTQRDSFIRELASLSKEKEAQKTSLKMRNQQVKIQEFLDNQIKLLGELEEKLASLQARTPSMDLVLNDLGDFLNTFLKHVHINKRTGISISPKSYAPVIREKDYYSITSGGLRTICSIGYMLSILDYSYTHETNHPKLLLIDTVGKYLGKTTKAIYQEFTDTKADINEGVSDPSKYKNIYNQIITNADKAQKLGVKSQIILVDNDVPDAMVESYSQYIVAHFSSTGESGLDYGLIDDANEFHYS